MAEGNPNDETSVIMKRKKPSAIGWLLVVIQLLSDQLLLPLIKIMM
jgi:hypothetical protein